MKKKLIIAIILIVVLVIAGYLLFMGNNQVNNPTVNESTEDQTDDLAGGTALEGSGDNSIDTAAQHEIMYTDSGYSPSEIKIKVGDTVVFKNQSSSVMWTASAMHPTHVVYSGTSLDEHCPDEQNTSFDQCRSSNPGESWSFTFTKVGTWGYHNHVGAGHFGKVIVE